MNRELKFRIWNNHAEEMAYKDFFVNNGTIVYDDGHSYEDVEIHNDLIVMQYTGLKDKNGKEIYEGDVYDSIRHTSFYCENINGQVPDTEDVRGVVEWDNESSGFLVKGISFFDLIDEDDRCDEVIGNIYESPELLFNE